MLVLAVSLSLSFLICEIRLLYLSKCVVICTNMFLSCHIFSVEPSTICAKKAEERKNLSQVTFTVYMLKASIRSGMSSSSVQSLSYSRLCDPVNHSTTALPVHHQLPELTQTHVH